MTLEELARVVPQFSTLNHAEKIKHFAWWLHKFRGLEYLAARDVTACYDGLSLSAPANIHSSFQSLAARSRKVLLKNSRGYRLERRVLDELTEKYGKRQATIYVDKLLTDLPTKLANPDERSYLEEGLTCFRNQAFRAAVVMTWNLTYDHLCYWVLADASRIASFNTQMAKSYAKKNYPLIVNRDSFEEPKEFEVLQVLASAGLINGGMHMILKEKLNRRNKAAHPTGTPILQRTAEDVIADLVENVVLKLQ